MNDRDLTTELKALGEQMLRQSPEIRAEDAVAATRLNALETRRRRPRRTVLLVGAAGLVFCAGAGAAAAVGTLSSSEVARGLPGGARIFEGTSPTCEELSDQLFLCTLGTAPDPDYVGTIAGNEAGPLNLAGYIDLFVDDEGRIAGGCRAITADGLRWLCVADALAVEYRFVGVEELGQVPSGVGVG